MFSSSVTGRPGEEDYYADEIESRNIELDFGTLEIFKQRTLYINFMRPYIDEDVEFDISRNRIIKSIKDSFEMDQYHGILKPSREFNMACTYKPILASAKDVEVFTYTDTDYENIKITVRGVAIGPHCALSAKNLEFYITPEKNLFQRKVEITNDSEASARFKIDHPLRDVFQVEPLNGIVKPHSYRYLSIKFNPKTPGIYARSIFCIVWNSDLLIVNVLGIYSTDAGTLGNTLQYYQTEPSLGFKSYLDDSIKTRKNIPPFSLTTHYLDFGSVLVDGDQPRTQVTSVTNHMNKPIFVNWDRGTKDDVFKITPDSARIAPHNSVQFEVEFTPEENFNVFQETMMAQVYWNLNESSKSLPMNCVPLSCVLRVQGHSFPNNEGWIAHVKVLPEVVYLKPCAPGEESNMTFSLQNLSHLPVLYKLLPPKKTNFIVKPMMGKFRKREIIAVQLQTFSEQECRMYIEEWKLIINAREDRPVTIHFHGESCMPIIEIGTRNQINAGSVQDGSQKDLEVTMKNQSLYSIVFQFHLIQNTLLNITPKSGTLLANSSMKLNVQVTGRQCAPKQEKFRCEMRIVDGDGAVSGNSFEAEVNFNVECSYSQLCACPSSRDFGQLAFGLRIKADFEAVNFGDTPIFFQTSQIGEDQHDEQFRIKPCFGEVRAKECKKFSINGIISQIGSQTLQFGYYNRMIKDSPLVTGDPIVLFNLSYSSEFPVIQVQEIVEHNFGKLFSKTDLYKYYLQIDRLNTMLKEIRNDETIGLELRLPEFAIQEKQFYFQLALTNITEFKTVVIFQRKKLCDCKLEEVTAGCSKRMKQFNCPHRDVLDAEMQDTRFYEQATRFLTIKIKYILRELTQVCYIMKMSNNRSIELYFNVYAIPPETPWLSFYTDNPVLVLKDVHLGARVAPIQTFWMYNNTEHYLCFEFDTKDIEHMCRIDGFQVLEILNPIDQIVPYQNQALLVKFHPIEFKTYAIKIPAKYYCPGQEAVSFDFHIEGEGIIELRNQDDDTMTLPRVPKFSSNFPINLSLEYIEVKMLPVWSKRKELIFIKNISRSKIMEYVWGTVNIENALEISTETQYSIIQPKEIQPVEIIIKTFSEPCIATVRLPCEVEYYCDKLTYKLTKEKYEVAESRIEEFMRGDKKTKRPKNPIIVPPNPDTEFASVVINITTIHTKDLDENIHPCLQLRHYPTQAEENTPKSLLLKHYRETRKSIFTDITQTKTLPPVTVNERLIFSRVLEDILSDVLFGKVMKTLLLNSIRSPMHLYNEFVIDERQIIAKKTLPSPLSNEDIELHRNKEINNFFKQLTIKDLSKIFQTLICDSILKLSQCHRPDFDIKLLDTQIEKSLYFCSNKSCLCNKTDDE